MSPVTVVFVHGACVRDGAWWWSRTAELLLKQGVDSVSARLPSCGETGLAPGDGGPSLDEDIAELRGVLKAVGPAILVSHSYGGVVATAAASRVDVRHLVYIDAFLPDVGESLSSFSGSEPAPYLDFAADGTFGAKPEVAEDRFLHDCDRDAVEGALARLTRQTAAAVAQPVTEAAWRTTTVVELPTGHHPMLSRPDLVAGAIVPLRW